MKTMENNYNVAHDVINLSTGTMATLTDKTNYDDLYEIQKKWYQWVFSLESTGTIIFRNWMHAWKLWQNR